MPVCILCIIKYYHLHSMSLPTTACLFCLTYLCNMKIDLQQVPCKINGLQTLRWTAPSKTVATSSCVWGSSRNTEHLLGRTYQHAYHMAHCTVVWMNMRVVKLLCELQMTLFPHYTCIYAILGYCTLADLLQSMLTGTFQHWSVTSPHSWQLVAVYPDHLQEECKTKERKLIQRGSGTVRMCIHALVSKWYSRYDVNTGDTECNTHQ